MATAADVVNGTNNCRKHLENDKFSRTTTFCADDNSNRETLTDGFQLMRGIQLDSVRVFSRPHGADIHVTPIIVDFRSLLLSKTGEEIVKGVSNHELLHTVVALYDVSLSEMTPDTLYASVCEKWARTILLIKDVNEALQEMQSDHIQKNGERDSQVQACEYDCITAEPCPMSDKDIHSQEDKYVVAEVKPSIFKCVFSDCEDECDTKETADDVADVADEEEFSHGLFTFLQRVHDSQRHCQQQTQPLTPDSVHIENRLVGAATFEKSYV